MTFNIPTAFDSLWCWRFYFWTSYIISVLIKWLASKEICFPQFREDFLHMVCIFCLDCQVSLAVLKAALGWLSIDEDFHSLHWFYINSDNGLSPSWHPPINWTKAGMFLTGPLETNLSEILIKIHTFSLKKMHLKLSSGKWWPVCLSLNVTISQTTFSEAFSSMKMFEFWLRYHRSLLLRV